MSLHSVLLCTTMSLDSVRKQAHATELRCGTGILFEDSNPTGSLRERTLHSGFQRLARIFYIKNQTPPGAALHAHATPLVGERTVGESD